MNIKIRVMEQYESNIVKKIAKESFDPFLALFVSKPKNALLACDGDNIVGGTIFDTYKLSSGKKIGHLKIGFVAKQYSGRGIGDKVYTSFMKHLKDEGCDYVIATVADDNIGSWRPLQKNGMDITSLKELFSKFGLKDSISLSIKTIHFISLGMDIWLTKDKKEKTNKVLSSEFRQMTLFIIFSLFLLSPLLLTVRDPIYFFSVITTLLIPMVTGKVVTSFFKEKWQFRLTEGGVGLILFLGFLNSVLPIVGRFYPKKYNKTEKQRFQMMILSLSEWGSLFVFTMICYFYKNNSLFYLTAFNFGSIYLFFRSIPFYPFGNYGGERIFNYNKILSLTLFAISFVYLNLLS